MSNPYTPLEPGGQSYQAASPLIFFSRYEEVRTMPQGSERPLAGTKEQYICGSMALCHVCKYISTMSVQTLC